VFRIDCSFRPEIELNGRPTRVLVEQTVAVDPSRLGDLVARLPLHDMSELDNALRVILGLTRPHP
jgi:mRNA interferase MazF